MQKTIKADFECLGKVLEGKGKIHSRLEESEYESFGEALKRSIAKVEEPDCAACIDGRCVNCLRSGDQGKLRPRKAGGSISTFVMMGLGDKNFLNGLEDTAHGSDDLYAVSADLQAFLGNRESGHEDCGAAMGAVIHVREVAQLGSDSPNLKFVKNVVINEFPGQADSFDEITDNVRSQAAGFAYILDSRGWKGEQYVDKLARQDPESVEILQHKDDEVHGHAEDALIIVDGPVDKNLRPIHTIDKDMLKELSGREAFVVNLNELRRDALLLGKTEKQKAQLYFSALIYHAGGAYPHLGDGSQPVFIVRIAQ